MLQSESKKYPTLGQYHWDVSDSRNIESAGAALEHLRNLTLRRIKGNGGYTVPASQDDYWSLMFHADSLFADGLYAEAKQVYDLAFTEDRYILPSQLSTVAKKMMAILKDRIDVREGRPQKYGTQRGQDGLCPLLDDSHVNEWRKEVGLPNRRL